MKKYGTAKARRSAADLQSSKHAPGRAFNPANGEPHTKRWLDDRKDRRRRLG